MRFVLVPAGMFAMGSPANEKGRYENEGPQHTVSVDAFLLAKTECTHRQWRAVMHFILGDLDSPVERVSWDDVQRFEQATGLSLPSEAQWEYAARAGTAGVRYAEWVHFAWSGENSGGKAHHVAMRAANAFGLHDMLGNVWEWCDDVWRNSYADEPTHSTRSASSLKRVRRGGSWSYAASFSRPASRLGCEPSFASRDVGFRPAWELR